MATEKQLTAMANARAARAAKRVQASAVSEPPIAVIDVPTDERKQCIFCGTEFGADILRQHMGMCSLKPEDITIDDLGDIEKNLPADASPGMEIKLKGKMPMKVKWTFQYLADLCDGKKFRYEKNGSVIDFHWETILAPFSTTVGYQGLKWYIVGGQRQKLPNCIAADLFASIEATRIATSAENPHLVERDVMVVAGAGLLQTYD